MSARRAVTILIVAALSSNASAQETPVGDEEIRATFVGKAACPQEPWPVSFGPHEFRPDGTYFRMQDIASAFGRYAVGNGRICISSSGLKPPRFCLVVTKKDGQYFFRHESPDSANQTSYLHTPCPLATVQ